MAGKRRRKPTETSLGGLAGVIAVGLIWEGSRVTLILLAVLFPLVWMGFFKSTLCDVETKTRGEACGNPARGHLRACHLHKRDKRDALWALLGMTNPGARYRVIWARRGSGHGRTSPAPEEVSPRVARPWYDGTMLVATIVGSAATAASLAAQLA